MSKATEWVTRLYNATEAQRHDRVMLANEGKATEFCIGQFGRVVGKVVLSHGLWKGERVIEPRLAIMTGENLTPSQAREMAHWILDVFGESDD